MIELWKRIKIRYKCAFFSTIIFGVIAQGMGLFNKFSMDDDLQYLFLTDSSLVLKCGRWMWYLMIRMTRRFFGDGTYSLPIINGLFSILCIAVSLCLLIRFLDIRSTTLCILLGGIAVSIPSVTHLFSDLYQGHYFSFALILAVLGPIIVMKKDQWYYTLFGIGLMVCSTAIYQGYIPVMLSTFLFGLIKMSAEADDRNRQTKLYKKAAIVFFSCLVFVGLYLAITFAINNHYHIDMSDYKGFNTMGKMPVKVYLQRFLIAYREFFLPSKNRLYNVFPGNLRILNYAMIAISFLLFGKLLYDRRKAPLSFISLLLFILLIPPAINFVFVMTEQSYCYMLMMYGRFMFFVIFAWALEKTIGSIYTFSARFAKGVCLTVLGLFVLMYCRYDNVCYLQITLLQTQATRYFTTLVTRIQNTEGYDSWKYVSYIGRPQPGNNDNSIEPIYELDNIMFFPYWGLKNTLQGPWKEYMRIWGGYSAHEVDQSYFKDNPVVEAMPHYPAEGSIKVIDDIVVVKF